MNNETLSEWEACKQLAEHIGADDPELAAYKIQAFINALNNQETPAMSLALAKYTTSDDSDLSFLFVALDEPELPSNVTNIAEERVKRATKNNDHENDGA